MERLLFEHNSFIFHEVGSLEVADPFFYRYLGRYYLIFTSQKGIRSFVSEDLINYYPVDNKINPRGYIYYQDDDLSFYAPEIFYFDGEYYLITSPNGGGHIVLKSSSLIGPYLKISENLHEMIDGSYFVDSDFKKYLLRADENGIIIDKVDNFNRLKFNKNGQISSFNINKAKLGGWNEGPMMIKRMGRYYLTFTGTHFLSSAYRVAYLSSDKLKANGFSKCQFLLLNTRREFCGLGHSSFFLGPDLDSYYIAYHHLDENNHRHLSISRLVFDKEKMYVNDYHDFRDCDFNFQEEKLSYLQEGNYIYLDQKLNDYSFEVSFLNAPRILLSLTIDSSITFELFSSHLAIRKRRLSDEAILKSQIIPFKKKINIGVLHTLRVQKRDNLLNIYLDNIELVTHFKLDFSLNNKIGYLKEEQNDILSFNYSKYSFGNSDASLNKVDIIVPSLFNDKDEEYSIYRVKKICDDKYHFDVLLNDDIAAFSIFINKKEYRFNSLNKGLHSLGAFFLKAGLNEIKLSRAIIDKINLIKIDEHFAISRDLDINFNSFNEDDFNIFHRYLIINDYLYFENDRNIVLTKDIYENFILTCTFNLRSITSEGHFISLVILNKNYGENNAYEGPYSLDGYLINLEGHHLKIIDNNFDQKEVLLSKKVNSLKPQNIKVIKSDNLLIFYLNEKEVLRTSIKSNNLRGAVGLYSYHASGYYKNLKISNLRGGKNE